MITRKLFILSIYVGLFVTGVMAQQTSTDTAWKLKAQQKGQATVPQYPKMLVVAQDGSGDYTTIQGAVNAVRDLSQEQVTIKIKPGTYHEKLVIPSWKKKISLIGESNTNTIITNNDYSGKDYPGGKDAFGRSKYSTYTSYTVLVQGDDVELENLTIVNSSGRVGQAVALHIEGDRAIIKSCRLLGNQDTVYTATESSRQYYMDCYIEGTTDFIFGEATCVFQRCTIKNLTNSYITAAATTAKQKYGYVFLDCNLISDTGASKCFLGRPWRPNAKTVFINTKMSGHILPVGWNNWGNPEDEKTVYYAEYKSSGPGANSNERAKWSKQLTDKEAEQFTVQKVFGDWDPAKDR